MGFLNQSIAQIRELFQSMTPAARVTAALLLGVIGVSLAYLFQDYSGGAKEFMLNGDAITTGEANRMQAAIAQAGLSDVERQGNQILVPRGQKHLYLAAVADANALPANLDTLLLDESSGMSWMTDNKTRDARMKAAREQTLSMMLRAMKGVEDAKVLFDVRESKTFGDPLITATVSVMPATNEPLTAARKRNIRQAVAGATAGLKPNDVVILDLLDGSQDDGGVAVDAAAFEEKYFQTKITYEEQMKARIEDLLRYVPGVRVQVWAELDETLGAESRAMTPGEPQPVREETDNTEISDTQLEDRGRPGPIANANTRTPPDEAVAKNEHRTQTNVRDTTNIVPMTEEVTRRTGMAPKEVRTAISIPSDWIVKVWREQNPDAAADERPPDAEIEGISKLEQERIQGDVSQLLPRLPQDSPYPNVRVTVYQSMTPTPQAEPSILSKAMMWAGGNSGSLIMAGLAVICLVMLRGMVKSIPVADTNVVLTLAGAGGDAEGMAGDGLRIAGADGAAGGEVGTAGRAGRDKGRPKLRLKKGPSLKDDLTDMVRDDPDAAAAILRTWISSAG